MQLNAEDGTENVKSEPGESDSLVLAFDDNRLLTELFGANDKHLARIEQGLDVLATSRGNKLVITGSRQARNQADRVFKDLYARLKSGQEVNAGDVDGVIRMATAPGADLAKTQIGQPRRYRQDISCGCCCRLHAPSEAGGPYHPLPPGC